MNGWEIAAIGLVCTLVCSFWGWLAVTVVKTQASVAALQARMDAKDLECGERMDSISGLFEKVNTIAEDTAFIKGKMS